MVSETLIIDNAGSAIAFQVKKLGILTVKGSITGFTGTILYAKEDLTAIRFDVCVSPSTINIGNEKRDEHLKSKDFFFVNEYPKICFQSTALKQENDGYKTIGNLSMLGVSREVVIPFSFTDGIFSGQLDLNRLDYGLGKKFPGFIVGKTIQISIKSTIK